MRRTMIIWIVILLLIPTLAAAQKKPGPPPPPPGPMEHMGMGGMGMGCKMMLGPEKWWHFGALSQVLNRMLNETADILNHGNVSNEQQKKLADILKNLADLAVTSFYPAEAMKPAEMQAKINDMQKTLDSLKMECFGATGSVPGTTTPGAGVGTTPPSTPGVPGQPGQPGSPARP